MRVMKGSLDMYQNIICLVYKTDVVRYNHLVAMVTTQNPEIAISKYLQVRHLSKTWSRLKICINMIESCIILITDMTFWNLR